jgi:hypothetical protein
MVGLLELLHQQPLLLMDGLHSVLEPLGVPPPHLHLLLAVHGPVLAKVLLLLLGLLEVRLQLVDLALLIPVLRQVYSHPILQTLLMLVHPGV